MLAVSQALKYDLLSLLRRPICHFSTNTINYKSCVLTTCKLKSRSLIHLEGKDTLGFLQGLITNDTAELEKKASIYTLLLNHQGRIICDSIIYTTGKESSEVYLECDSSLRTDVLKHLKVFKLRKDVKIKEVDDRDVWAAFDIQHEDIKIQQELRKQVRSGDQEFCCGSGEELKLDVVEGSKVFPDPRLSWLGWRILKPSVKISTTPNSEVSYTQLRYALGVPEGQIELPRGACFPLESNADYLNGINFHKGCYLGQELTARTHHTGVVRKRLMPFRVSDGKNIKFEPEDAILDDNGKRIGKVRGVVNGKGIALARIDDALHAKSIFVKETPITIYKPLWWPSSDSKDSSVVFDKK